MPGPNVSQQNIAQSITLPPPACLLPTVHPGAISSPEKKARLENEDETDFTIFPDLKRISTFAKLERWVSEPEISQKLISDLERQLGDKGMADLKKKLKDKEPKNILCFNANNIDNIRKNKELDKFLSKTNNTEIPKLTFSMFFKKGGSVSSGNNAQSSDMQETRIHEMKEQPQRFNVPNVPRHIDVSLSQYDPFTKKKPLEDDLGSTDMKEPWTDKIDEQLKRSNVPMHEDESLHQKEQITKKETPLEDRLGSTDMQDANIDEIDEESQRSNVPMHIASLHQDESIIKNKMPLEDRCGNMNMQHNEQANMQVNPEPFSSKQLQDNSPGSASKYSYSTSLEYLPQNNKRLPEEEVLAVFSDTGDKDIMIHENKDNENESKTTEQPCGGSFLQMHHEVKADAPSQEPTDMQGTHIDEKEEQSQRSNVPMYEDLSLYQNDPFTKKETPLENRCGSTDMQETRIHEMKEQPQRFNVPNVPRHIDVSLSQYDPLIKKEPLEDGLGSTDMKEPWTDKIDEQLIRSNVPMHEEESRYQKDQITKKETPLEDRLGSTDMQDTNIDEIDEESQRSNVPMHIASLHQDESIIKNKMPLEDRCGNMNMQHNEQTNMQVNPEPFSSKQLQDNSPGSASKYSYSTSLEYLPQNNKRLPEEEVLAVFSDTGDKDIMIHENKDNENESKTTEQPCGGSFLQMHHEVKADAPSQEPTDMQGTHIDEKEEQSQRSNVPMYEDLSLYQNDPFTKKETPLENRCGSTDMQETRIHEMKEQPQRFNVPNVPRHIDVSLSQYNPLIKKEPLEDGLGSTDMKEPWTDKIDEQLKRSNVPMHKEESRYQKDQITKKETPLEDGLGSTDMQNTHNDKIDEEHQKSNVPMHAACLHQDESIIKNKMPLEDRCGNMNMQHNEQANMQVNPEPFSSKQLQDNSPGSASKYTQSNSTEFLAQYKNTAILAPNRDVKDQTEATKKREKSKCQKEKKKKSKDDLLLDWAMRQCNDRKEELKNILDQISIINMAEHSDYPCFTAENVMVYKYLTPESQIIFIADDSSSISTMTMVHYHMFVCNIKKAILLGPKKQDEQEIQYIESKVPVDTCTGFIFKAFAPALTVYKKIQKEEKLYSLI
ncbi:uncharacterized protein LOC113547703 isoform X2 [Pangasianodon hypophthalmus]|uniref:uncharacterized protein LOC113547703 isoform X2 n=1 Tax=Pangasianodon hypophthalmus TaxID=310915 RepID=UPI0023073BC5|nr:uncharacterized protein LOC113547703 isoform X2 [Pangasianodon hypophthalmus]